MVPNLGCVVEHSARRGFDNVVKGELRFGFSLEEVFQIVQIGLVVFLVVEAQCFFREVRGEGSLGVGERGKFKFQNILLFCLEGLYLTHQALLAGVIKSYLRVPSGVCHSRTTERQERMSSINEVELSLVDLEERLQGLRRSL
jgi:hypothetical protein